MSHADIAEKQAAWMPVNELQWLAARMCIVTALGAALAVGLLAWVWSSPANVAALVMPRLALPDAAVTLDAWTRTYGFAVSTAPLAVLLFALYQAYELFAGYRRGRMFTFDATVRLRRIGMCMVALAVLRPLTHTALCLVLTAHAPPGRRMLSIALSLDDYMIAAFGGLVLAIGHVMVAAARMADDHSRII